MAKRIRYLTDAELEIMRVIWDSNDPMDSTQIQKGLYLSVVGIIDLNERAKEA